MLDIYRYTGRVSGGKRVKGTIGADSEPSAIEKLQESGIAVTSLKRGIGENKSLRLAFMRKDYSEQVALLSRNLATYHRSGISMLQALGLIKLSKDNDPFQRAIESVRKSVSDGKTLSMALAEFPDIFNDVFINAVEAGETSGQLAEILDDTAKTLERDNELRREIKSALRYPLIVVIAIALAVVVIMTFVIPRFAAFYGKFGSDLPTPTRIVVYVSDTVRQYWYLALAFAGALGWALRRFYLSERGRELWDGFFLKIPVFGPLIIKSSVARFALLLRVLFRSGIPLVKALAVLARSQGNIHLRNEVDRMRESFEAGRELEPTASADDHFPQMARNMIRSGLASGSLDMMLGEIGKHYTREVNHTSRMLASLIEPALTIFIGAIVLILALAIFLPMWNMIKVFN